MSNEPTEPETLDQRRKRAAYRSNYRGTKEMDWFVGKYAAARLDGMSEQQLGLFEKLLGIPDPELQVWLLDPSLIADMDIGPLVAEMHAFHGLGGRKPS